MEWEPQTKHGDALAMALVIGIFLAAGLIAIIIVLNDTEKLQERQRMQQMVTPTVTTTMMYEVAR